MGGYAVRLLGPPEVRRDGLPLAFKSRKALTLLAYLTLEDADSPTLPPVKIRGGVRTPAAVVSARVQHKITGGQMVELAGGIEVIDTPGHSADHRSFFWQSFLWHSHGGVLFIGDAVANENGHLRFGPFSNDLEAERRIPRPP